MKIKGSVAGDLTIDWGDGSPTETNAGTGDITYTHTYAQPGKYDITVARSTGTVTFGEQINAYDKNIFREVNVGSNTRLYTKCFYRCMNLQYISIPSDCNVTDFGGQFGAKCLIFPSMALANNTEYNDGPVEVMCFAKQTATNNYANKFRNLRSLRRISAPIGTSGGGWGNQMLNGDISLQRFLIADGVTSLSSNGGNALWSLQKLTIPSSVATVNGMSETHCLQELHMKATTPPTLSNTSQFSNRPSSFTIYVPRSENQTVLNAYKTASNWVNYASSMQEEPE